MRVPVTQVGGGIKLGKPTIVHDVGTPPGFVRDVYDVSTKKGQFALLDIEYIDHPVMVTDWPNALID